MGVARGRGARRRGARGRGGATAVKRGRLLDRMPVLLVGRDRGQQVVLVRPARAAAVVLRLALLHADPGDEDDVVEVLVLGLVQREVLLAGVALLDAARAFEDLLQAPAISEHHLLLTSVEPANIKLSQNLRLAYGPSRTTNSQSSISASPLAVRLYSPSGPALPGRMRICVVAIVLCGMSSEKSRGSSVCE